MVNKNVIAITLFFASLLSFSQSSIVGIYSDFGGFLESTTTSLNPTSNRINAENNLLGFTVGTTTYSTGVDDAILTANSVIFTPAAYVGLVPAVATSGNGGQGSLDDGDAVNFTSQLFPTPGQDVRAYLTDGVNGLGLSTFANNVGGTFIFNLSDLDALIVGDGIPDFIYFNNAAPGTGSITFELYAGATLLGSASSVENSHPNVARLNNDRFNTSTGMAAAEAVNQNLQGFAMEISDLGVTSVDFATATELRVILPTQADPPFVAYNSNGFTAIDPNVCTILDSGLASVSCNGNGTPVTGDDFIEFTLNPTGNNLGTTYTVSVSTGSVTPTTGTYGAVTTFSLQAGSVGSGDVVISLSDDSDPLICTLDDTIIDPGSCCPSDSPIF